jgi:hypothetical protein
MKLQDKQSPACCPVAVASIKDEVRQTVENLLGFCESFDGSFFDLEKQLPVLMMALGRLFMQLFLTARHSRLDLEPYLQNGQYRLGNPFAERTLKTAYGEVSYGRAHLIQRRGGAGFYPLDVVLVLTRDQLSPWLMQLVGKLATRMSFGASRLVCKALLQWAPATETIERVVLGMGREAAPFMQQMAAPEGDGEVLIIEVDGKCPPTATAAELTKRRGKRKPKHKRACPCGCQRHRGRAKRKARGSKKRRKKGDKSKNGKEVITVVMYTLKRGDDGRLHGPLNKKVWGTFAGRKAAAQWARAQATKRGFDPDTSKTVQILLDGANSLKSNMERLFPKAIFTMDVWHVVERLWSVGRHFHKEGTEELAQWVEELKTLLYGGKAAELVERLQELLRQVPLHGPGTKARRKALRTQINFLQKRIPMMQYAEWRKQDLVIGTGQVEGAVRHVVGERMDCAGMRWVQGKGEALLHLRCIEINGDWDAFVDWLQNQTRARLRQRQPTRILTDQPIRLKKAA